MNQADKKLHETLTRHVVGVTNALAEWMNTQLPKNVEAGRILTDENIKEIKQLIRDTIAREHFKEVTQLTVEAAARERVKS